MVDSILFPLLCELREQGILLGTSDYLLVLEAISTGLGLENCEQFKRLLRLLWTKSQDEQKRFDRAFAKWVETLFHPSLAAKKLEEEDTIEQFKLFCCSIWLKSQEDRALFNQAFAELVEPQLTETIPSLPSPSPDEPPPKLIEKPPPNLPKPVKKPGEPQRQITIGQKKVRLHFDLTQPPSLPGKPNLLEDWSYYHLDPRLPLLERVMVEAWRQLRRPQRVGRPEELDVEGTIDSLCRTGYLLRPVLRPRRRNQVRLVVLIDQLGSMMPFTLVVKAIRDSLIQGGLKGRTNFYYFHDCPEYLYKNPKLTGAVSLETVFEQAQGNSVLIISDAGAAYGFYDDQRRKATQKFLIALRKYTYLYAWLNPMPKNRWAATTAEEIDRFVPMYPLNREGLSDIVNILRGHPFPQEVSLNG